MAATDFASQTSEQRAYWARKTWQPARNEAFVSRFMGSDENSMIHVISDYTKTEKGDKAIITLLADLLSDGVIGDNQREGNEEAMSIYDFELPIDLISHAVKNKGKLSDQKSTVSARDKARGQLQYWLQSRLDELSLLSLSGISYAYKPDGSARSNSPFPGLAFQPTAPTSARRRTWTGTSLSSNANTTSSLTTSSTASYKMITQSVAYARDHYIKPIVKGGKEYFVLLVKPGTLAQLKNDTDFKNAVNQSGLGNNNPFFTGAITTIDGVVIHEHRLVYSTTGTATKWGAGTDVEGTRSLLCGAQALAMADITPPDWAEEMFDLNSKYRIGVDKMLSLIKPKFYSAIDGGIQDFGVLAIDHYLS